MGRKKGTCKVPQTRLIEVSRDPGVGRTVSLTRTAVALAHGGRMGIVGYVRSASWEGTSGKTDASKPAQRFIDALPTATSSIFLTRVKTLS